MAVKRKNPKWAKKLLEKHKKISGKVVAVGFPKGTNAVGVRYPDGTPLLNVAVWNNYGTSRIPRRDFMSAGIVSITEKTNPIAKRFAADINSGKIKADTVLEQMGVVAAGALQLTIRDLKDPPNAPSTIRIKKSANPLVDTGLLIGAVTYIVREQ
jgi:hypothetical protein